MNILGISAFYHDSAAALLRDGEIVGAAQEERFSRKKHDPGFPSRAIEACLRSGGLQFWDIDHVAFYDKPFLKFERLLETYLSFAPRGFASFRKSMPIWLREKLFQKDLLRKKLSAHQPDFDWDSRLLFAEHHLSHAASAFYPSPFERAAVLTMDGVGEWTTTSIGTGDAHRLAIDKEIHFPHSLGLLYSAFTYYLGFKVNSGEYKVMGLAPYGEPKYADLIFERLIDLKADGSFRLDLSYFDYCTGLRMTNERFDELFGGPPRQSETDLGQREMDLAASVQFVIEQAVLALTRAAAADDDSGNLCLAGGVALNCVANGKILRDGSFKQIWTQPAAGDAGGALGAALAAFHGFLDQPRNVSESSTSDRMAGSYLGPVYAQAEIESELDGLGAVYERLSETDLPVEVSKALADEMAVGWFQGRMEFGPRALGARSILGDPRSPNMQSVLNQKVKFRESFRPFAPAVLREHLSTWFDLDTDSPYMLLVSDVHPDRCFELDPEQKDLFGIDKLQVPRSEIPAVTHVDYSARIQTVHADTNPRFHALLTTFYRETGCPVVINTSFNVRGEPIVGSPTDAFRCFMGTGIERLAIGDCWLRKEDQDPSLIRSYHDSFDLD